MAWDKLPDDAICKRLAPVGGVCAKEAVAAMPDMNMAHKLTIRIICFFVMLIILVSFGGIKV